MKVSFLIQRRSRCRKSPTISLFPFLAVLICTMGALVPLLLAIARQARLQALQEANAKAAQTQADAQTQREMAEWRIGELTTSRKQAEERLSQARLALGHVEDHTRQLRQQAAQLKASLDDLEKNGTQGNRKQAALEGELAEIQAQIGQAEKQLATAQNEAGNRRRSYAIIPYEGPHGTYRPPIYIECRPDAIVLQPEGVALAEADFNEPIEAGNALDRALRAAREVLLAQKRIKGDGSDEPYPLLLVRPDGIVAYYVARTAMKSWKSEVGYELIGKDWDLEFPKPNPQVRQAMLGAVADAREERRRQAMLVAMLSNARSGGQYPAMLGAGTMGGGGTGGAGGTGGGVGRSGMPGTAAGSPAGFSGSGGVISQTGGSSATSEGTAGSANRGAGTSAAGNAPPSGTAAGESSFASDGAMAASVFGETKPAQDDSRYVYRAAPGGGLIREIDPDASSSSSSSTRKSGYSAGRRSAGETTSAGTATRKVAPQPAGLRAGEWIPEEPKPPQGPEDEDKDNPDAKSKRGEKKRSLAESRGENWGLPNAARGSVGITRPIRVRCSSNRLEILPDRGDDDGASIALGARTEDAMDGFVSAVWEHMKTWGIGGRGMYWRPILEVEVTPDAEYRYAELKALLDNSGLIVQRSANHRQ